MRRVLLLAAGVACFLAAPAPASAQAGDGIEILAGFRYPLVSQEFNVEQSTGWSLGASFRVKGGFFLGARYESYGLEDDIGLQGDADLTLYGATATFDLNDDDEVRILGTVGAGLGELEWMNPGPPVPSRVDSTDIDLWYEAGVAVEFHAGERWLFRLGLALKQVRPEEKSVLLESTRAVISPSFDVGIRF